MCVCVCAANVRSFPGDNRPHRSFHFLFVSAQNLKRAKKMTSARVLKSDEKEELGMS